jgi:hypothetical protein
VLDVEARVAGLRDRVPRENDALAGGGRGRQAGELDGDDDVIDGRLVGAQVDGRRRPRSPVSTKSGSASRLVLLAKSVAAPPVTLAST